MKTERINDLEKLIDRYVTLLVDYSYTEEQAIQELQPITSKKLMQMLCTKLQINIRGNR